MKHRLRLAAAGLVVVGAAAGTLRDHTGEPVRVVIPPGSTLSDVADSLSSRGVIGYPSLFGIYARARGAARDLKAGTYDLETGTSWRLALRSLTRGEVVTVPMTIPEGYRLEQMAIRIAELSGESEERVLEMLETSDATADLPGPGLEGYLFPDTYRFARGVPVEAVIEAMVERYREVWTPRRRARLSELEMAEREIVTLASIVQAEARQVDEMPRISGVYHNRLDAGWLLQADPTVLYALGGYRERLLYAAIDSVADHPYNTYARAGLPPGPIGAPGEAALEAALRPAEEEFLYFVARPDGSHVFTRTLSEHNRAKAEVRRERGSG